MRIIRRYQKNDLPLLDDCSFVDPRTKELRHLTPERRKRVKERVISILQTASSNSETDEDISESTDLAQAKPTPIPAVSQSSSGLLASLLTNFQSRESEGGQVKPDAAEAEVEKYLTEDACDLKDEPLVW